MAKVGKVHKGKTQQVESKGEEDWVPVGPYNYKVIYGEIANSSDWGRVEYDKRTMWVDDTDGMVRTAVILVHEIFHAIGMEYDLWNGSKDVEERVINHLSLGLVDILRRSTGVRDRVVGGLVDG